MKYVADRFKSIKPSLTLDADAISKYTDLVDLSIGDTDFITDSRIIDAAMADAKKGYTKYGFPKGDPELIGAICSAWEEDFHQKVHPDQVIVTASSCLGMAELLTAILNPGDEVIVPAPYFAVYKQQIEMPGGICIEVPSCKEEGFHLNEDRLRAAITPKTRAIIINNPCNPTGIVYNRTDLMLIAQIALQYDLLILADEIYTRYVFDGPFIPMRTLPDIADHVVTLNSFSKNFMMTGWRVGYIIGPEEIIRTVDMINGGMIYTAPSVSQRAAIHALSMRDDIEKKYVAKYRERLNYAADRIENIPYMTLTRPGGTFYLFPGISSTGLSSAAFCKRILTDAHVLASPGHVFGSCGEGHIRLTVTQPMEKLEAAFDRLEKLKF